MHTFLFLLLLMYICMREILYVSQLFMGEMFVMREIYMLGGRERETVSRQETPSQCGRVDRPGFILFSIPQCIRKG